MKTGAGGGHFGCYQTFGNMFFAIINYFLKISLGSHFSPLVNGNIHAWFICSILHVSELSGATRAQAKRVTMKQVPLAQFVAHLHQSVKLNPLFSNGLYRQSLVAQHGF
jgi:hypothetical protein